MVAMGGVWAAPILLIFFKQMSRVLPQEIGCDSGKGWMFAGVLRWWLRSC